MKINKNDLLKLVKEEVNKQDKKQLLVQQIEQIQEEISRIDQGLVIMNEFVNAPSLNPGVNMQPQAQDQTQVQAQPQTNQQNFSGEVEESESIFDARPGETVIFNFQDVTIKVQRQLDDLFKVVDAAESKKLKDGDYIKIKGNDILKRGRKFSFSIFREAGIRYESNSLLSWKVIKNK